VADTIENYIPVISLSTSGVSQTQLNAMALFRQQAQLLLW